MNYGPGKILKINQNFIDPGQTFYQNASSTTSYFLSLSYYDIKHNYYRASWILSVLDMIEQNS